MSLFGSTDSKDSEELWFPSFGQKRHSVPVLRRTTTVYGKPTAPGHWIPLHLPSLPSQNSKAVSEGRQEQTKQQPLTFSSCPKHHFPLNLCYFHLQKQHHTTCHLPDFRNPSSASGEAETSEASEEDRTTTSGKSEDPPGTWLGGSVEWDPSSEKEHSASRTGGDSLVEDGVETKELDPRWASLLGLPCAGTPPSKSDLATEFTWHGEICWWKHSSCIGTAHSKNTQPPRT